MDKVKNQRKRGKDKSKNTYKKYGKYTNKATRIREDNIEKRLAKNRTKQVKKNKN